MAVGLLVPAAPAVAGEPWRLSLSPISGPVSLAPGCVNNQDENTPQVAVDPTDPADLAATYAIGDGSASVLARSSNAGRSWTRSPIAGTLTCNGSGGTYASRFDPDLGFDPVGRLHLTESVQAGGTASGTAGINDLLLTAEPGADALGAPVPVAGSDALTGAQRGFLAFPTDRPGGVDVLTERIDYPAGQYSFARGSLQISIGSDGSRPPQLHDVYTHGPDTTALAEGLISRAQTLLAFGELIGISQAPAQFGLGPAQEQAVVLRSDDGGVHWSSPTAVFTHSVDFSSGQGCCLTRPVMAKDGTLYWGDASDGKLSVDRSGDAGASWTSEPVPGASGVTEPTLAAGGDGQVMASWYQLSADGNMVTPRIAVSTDRGGSWQSLGVGGPVALSSLGPVDDTSPLGPVQGAAATPNGFVAAMTVGGPLVTAGGGSDVDLITVTPAVSPAPKAKPKPNPKARTARHHRRTRGRRGRTAGR